jgi:oligoendopeptidase F
MRVKVDATDQRAAAQHEEAMGLIARAGEAFAYFDPELLRLDPGQFQTMCHELPALARYAHAIDKLRRRAAHIQAPEVERVLASASDLANSPHETYKALVNGELVFGAVTDASGGSIVVTQGAIFSLLRRPERAVRQAAWESYADAYLHLRGTFAHLYAAAVKRDIFFARARDYPSALDAALEASFLPRAVFDNLLATWRGNLPLWHRYFEIRRRALGVERLHSYDLDVPLVRTRSHFPYDQARALICAAMAPLGAEYTRVLRRGLYEERWVDWAANVGKAGGAEQSGAYGLHPFVLLTYDESLTSVSGLAHELGHAMHTHFTNATQPPAYEDCASYLAETASTFSQSLLCAYLARSETDPDLQLEALADALGYFHRYLLVMPLLARFEMECHERVERGDGLSADWLGSRMVELLGQAYGPAVTLDAARDGVLWAQFPHLYLNFYTYQYALGLAAATALADGVRREGESAAVRYIEFLKAGDSVYPLDAWQLAGVNMTSPEPLARAHTVLGEMIDRLEALVGEGPLH